jgi:hypothetical protein
MIKSINISPELWEKHKDPNFSKSVTDALEFYDKVKEMSVNNPDNYTFGLLVRSHL